MQELNSLMRGARRLWPLVAATLALCATTGQCRALPGTLSAASGATMPATSIVPTLLALAVVIAAIVLLGWMFRLFGPATRQGESLLRAVAQLSVGPKERVVILDCAGETLVIGVTAQTISLLARHDCSLSGNEPNGKEQAPPKPVDRLLRMFQKTRQKTAA